MVNQSGFKIGYNDGRTITGDLISDAVNLGNMTVDSVTMAVATELIDWHMSGPGIMGIGSEAGEAMGFINSRSYSIWLDDLGAANGTILFGGYDTDKYTGNLTVLKILDADRLKVWWSSLTLTDSNGSITLLSDSFPYPASLDIGSSASHVPSGVWSKLCERFGVRNQNIGTDAYPNDAACVVPCDLGYGSLDFGFGGSNGTIVSVPFSELAPPGFNARTGEPLYYPNGTRMCLFGLTPGTDGDVFGDTLLRSAYVVYDLDNEKIAIAQSNVSSTSSNNIVEIPVGGLPFAGTGV
ncbi:hypothetical protein LTR36_009775 [Oleoguttula mirabilis]|uniref:Peptidase A1 domain-containing protein n=1 Tax=Oleoguttula mirabilis TaxID=1507867 RepID=A0AAV9J547_9PEZI|nr:hypothetical protein LTR36_009775 [Oleoguttula mirabilis]